MATTLHIVPTVNSFRPLGTAQDRSTSWVDGYNNSAYQLSTSAPSGASNPQLATSAGPITDPGLVFVGSIAVSYPLAADATISGTVTIVTSGLESNAMANAGLRMVVWRLPGNGDAPTVIANSVQASELGTTAARTSRTATPTSTNLLAGDQIAVAIYADDVGGTMATGYLVTARYGGAAGGTNEASVTFTENLTFDTTTPTGTTLYLEDTVAFGSVYDLVTTAPSTSGTDISATTTAWPAVDFVGAWITPSLSALTDESGWANFSLSGLVNDALARATYAVKLFKVDADGTSNKVQIGEGTENDNLGNTITTKTFSVPIQKFSLAANQRLLLEVYATTGATINFKASGYTFSVRAGSVTDQSKFTLPFTITPAGPTTVNATAAFNGGGSLSATGVVTTASTATLTQGATLTATGGIVVAATAALTQGTTLTATGTVVKSASATFTQGATLTATGVVGTSVAFTATATLTATAVRVILATAALTSSHTLTASGVVQAAAVVAFTSTATLTTTAFVQRSASVALTQGATLTATGVVGISATFAAVGKMEAQWEGLPVQAMGWHLDPVNSWQWLGFGYAWPGGTVKEIDGGARLLWDNNPPQSPTGNAAVGLGVSATAGWRYIIRIKVAGPATGPRVRPVVGFVTGGSYVTPSLTPQWMELIYDETSGASRIIGIEAEGPANGVVAGTYIDVLEYQVIAQRLGGTVTLNGGGTLTAAGTVAVPATAAFTQGATLTATGTRVQPATAAFTQGATLTAAPATISTSVALTAQETLTAAATRVQPASVALSAQETFTATAVREQPATVALTAQETLSATGTVVKVGTATFTQDATLTALWSASGVVNATAAFNATGTLTATGFVTRGATASFTQSTTLTASGTRVQGATVTFTSTATLTSAATLTLPSVAAFAASETLTVTGGILRAATALLTETHTLVAEATVTYALFALDPSAYPQAWQQLRYVDRTTGLGRWMMRQPGPVTRKALLLYRPSVTYPHGRVVQSSHGLVGSGWDADTVIQQPESFRTNNREWEYDVLTNNGYALIQVES